MTQQTELQQAIQREANGLVQSDVSPPVAEHADVNRGFCQYVAEKVYKELSCPDDVRILKHSVGMGDQHVWLEWNGRHFDAECPEGVSSYRQLPFFQQFGENLKSRSPRDITGQWETVQPDDN